MVKYGNYLLKRGNTMLKKKSYTVASFFSGCGGLDYGFHQSGFKVLFANDFWKDATNSFHLNYPKIPFIQKPIQDISDKEKVLVDIRTLTNISSQEVIKKIKLIIKKLSRAIPK